MRKKLGELLIQSGAASAADVASALADQASGEPNRIGDLLLSNGKVSPLELAQALSVQNKIPFVQLTHVEPEASWLVALEFQREHKLVPFRIETDGLQRKVCVAMADPTGRDVVEILRNQLKRPIDLYVAAIDDIERVHAELGGEPVAEGVLLEGVVLDSEPGSEFTHVGALPEIAPVIPPAVAPLSAPPTDDWATNFEDMTALSAPVVSKPPPPKKGPAPADDLFGSFDDLGEAPVENTVLGLSTAPSAVAMKSNQTTQVQFAVAIPPPEIPSAVLGKLPLKKIPAPPRESSTQPLRAEARPPRSAVRTEPQLHSVAPAELPLPEWMTSPAAEAGVDPSALLSLSRPISEELDALLGAMVRAEAGAVSTPELLAALVRSLVERGLLDETALLSALGKR